MVAQEWHIAEYDWLLIIRVGDFIYILTLAGIFLNPAFELGFERREHPSDEFLHRHRFFAILHLYKIVVHFSHLGTASVNRHFKCFLLNYFPEPFSVQILGRIHIYPHNQRTGEFGFKPIDFLSR